MGLDMYLHARRYISNHEFDPEGQKLAQEVLSALGVKNFAVYIGSGITVELRAAYWRKANAEHNWFVSNVQDGEDNCASYYVSREQLKRLVDLCQSILDNKETPDMLPPASGFFFGSDEIDEWYFQDLKDTINQITAALNNPDFEKCEFYYQSSW